MAPRKRAEGERKAEPATASEQAGRAFAELLAWHMDIGTRPDGKLQRWSSGHLAAACGVTDRTVRNWRNGTYLPDIDTLSRALFGRNPAHDDAHSAFRAAWANARQRSDSSWPLDHSILPPPRCFGRDDAVADLTSTLTQDERVALLVLGPAGIGKTTLTRRVVTDPTVVRRFAGRRWFVELETAGDATALRAAIIRTVGLNPATVAFTATLEFLARQPALLVLDNLDVPWEADQHAVQETLQALATTEGVSLIASLRGFAAPPSPRWTARPVVLPPLSHQEARRLFLDLAPEAEADPDHLLRFLAALAGVPLAVELVALRAAGGTPLQKLWADWERLGVGFINHPDQDIGRLTSLRRSLDLSWESRRLHDEGRRLFRVLGQLPDGIVDDDALALFGNDAWEAERQLRTIGLAFNRDGRLDLLSPVRVYARIAHPPGPADHANWCRHYLALARDSGGHILGADGAVALSRLIPDRANIEAALAAADAVSLRSEAVAALSGVWRLLSATGVGSPASLGDLGKACNRNADTAGEAACHFWLGLFAFHRLDQAAARETFKRALSLFRQVADVLGEANCLERLGELAQARAEHVTARSMYEHALLLFRQVADLLGQANCIYSLGSIALEHADYGAAQAAFEQALPLYRQISDVLGEANCVRGLGSISLDGSDFVTACEAFEQALLLYRQTGDVIGEANCIQGLGDIALRRSETDVARTAFEQALPLYHQVGDVRGEAICFALLGRLAQTQNDLASARSQFETALSLFGQIQAKLNSAVVHEGIANITAGEERERHVQTAMTIWTAIDRPDQVERLKQKFY